MKYCVLLCLCLLLVGCNKTDSHYYWRHPHKLKLALLACPNRKPAGVTCEQLTNLANHFQNLAIELKRNPQQFGLKIITLQQKISTMEQEQNKKQNKQLAKKLQQSQQRLAEYLAVVSHYESPRGVSDEDSGQ